LIGLAPQAIFIEENGAGFRAIFLFPAGNIFTVVPAKAGPIATGASISAGWSAIPCHNKRLCL
jgi:hypothetical protein